MALTQAERIEISKKIIDIPVQNAAFDNIKAALDNNLVKLTNEDNANKSLMDIKTALIDPYQLEFNELDGNIRVELTEQDMIDSANRIKQNFFFPNDPDISLPSIPDGIWKFLTPFSGSVAIGKRYTEDYATAAKEQDSIDDVNSKIAVVEAATPNNGLCSDTQYTDQATCELNSETWTTLAQTLTDLTGSLNSWKSFLQAEQALIVTDDSDAPRQAENDIAIADITNTISIIDTWLAAPSELTLQPLKDETAARTTFISTRTGQLSTNLGSVGQNLTTGEINGTGSGFYDDRFKAINVRLNLLGGSLIKKISVINSQDAQDAQKATNDSAATLYNSVMTVSLFRAPAANTGTIHVLDASGFSISDTIYVVAEDQGELTGTISNISGNTVFLDFTIPEKYTHNNRSRLYKVL